MKKFYLAGALGLSDATEHRCAVVRSLCVPRLEASFVRPSSPWLVALLLVVSAREGPKISKWPWKGGPVVRFHSARHALTRGFPRTIQVHREDRATRVGTIGEELGRTGPQHEGLYLAEGLSAVADARCRHFPRGCRLSSEYYHSRYRFEIY